ncbi:MAG: glycerol-3-phosphate 1-O-acyltransferase PlsY [Candidatus Gastranaerophilaceae bacterium]|jgi:acyl-phosphate glycerol 3-phosphate acyltransferase|uniref:Glycerol-3-phosphate acyltransferase n=1 Tax=Candidatus Limenecus avicola TaxID=2840847 RepID=A0A9D1MZS8_9CLOT|nr:glycerol-3-phosphate acyltransferase [Clostridium sp. CAG:306]DAB26476.1 MAG TPA: acyl-phosphate glycerol 3-phosphate acyltransferase [Candidatus Gastranaerophilales bacterium HUM_21]HIU92194.1 glycerol-3-phosphate 1-O-acyltransferase PlsY [Candidatus Limenecus avicola]
MLQIAIAIVMGYLIGSIPTGYLIVKAKTGQDIRKVGSGSTGATNVKRVLGKKWFFIVMLLDAIKGALPVVLAILFLHAYSQYGLTPVAAAVAVLLGHSKSVFLGFTGGKSVASGVGTILALNPLVGLSVAVIWGIITWVSKYVSLGSIIALAVSPFIMWAFKQPAGYIAYCALGAVYIIWLHRENIKRLIKGEENKVRQ